MTLTCDPVVHGGGSVGVRVCDVCVSAFVFGCTYVCLCSAMRASCYLLAIEAPRLHDRPWARHHSSSRAPARAPHGHLLPPVPTRTRIPRAVSPSPPVPRACVLACVWTRGGPPPVRGGKRTGKARGKERGHDDGIHAKPHQNPPHSRGFTWNCRGSTWNCRGSTQCNTMEKPTALVHLQ